MGNIFSPTHLIVILLIILVLFGRGKISEFMGDFAKGIKSFKKGMKDEDETEEETVETPPAMKTIDVQPEPAPAPVKRRAAPQKTASAKTSTSARTTKAKTTKTPARKTTKSKS
ncbi:twin-arginine translocase TatA/TatE family subunit [Bartonella sp. LJL80]